MTKVRAIYRERFEICFYYLESMLAEHDRINDCDDMPDTPGSPEPDRAGTDPYE